jgi:hypothetical protein
MNELEGDLMKKWTQNIDSWVEAHIPCGSAALSSGCATPCSLKLHLIVTFHRWIDVLIGFVHRMLSPTQNAIIILIHYVTSYLYLELWAMELSSDLEGQLKSRFGDAECGSAALRVRQCRSQSAAMPHNLKQYCPSDLSNSWSKSFYLSRLFYRCFSISHSYSFLSSSALCIDGAWRWWLKGEEEDGWAKIQGSLSPWSWKISSN